ncbi:hypothetical protein DPMN_028598 [Dreissena polymorpha]|uniref:Uncharacterized protein n=1 Tax=Dreissena polymorpha TaxID=45954 RepID=A0A9D4RFH0_DREPO|nr:hypothetical protein DPMN_028598 [Dreissena polymorpha]
MLPEIYRFAHLRGFHDDWTKNVTSRVHVIQLTGTIFELNSHIQETNVRTKFHENWAKNVTSRVFPYFHYIHIDKNAPPTGGHVYQRSASFSNSKTALPTGSHVFQPTGTTFELNQHFIKTNILTKTKLLTKFHEDRTINVASRVFTNKCGRTDDGRMMDKDRSQKLT